ncbi:beta-lactamase-like protein [Tricharina praecox]|uniref:beta-lactamase-like protein n=1 Tax=Tricharina praecox TaxID=43433 RepID=UPI00221FB299|nr:beta-lactamase-like protein [Tricharina praecox]KAI5855443.1 beta-lactamase-like protein [Tricharina praecox]
MEACYVARTPMTSTRIMATAHNEFLKAQFASLPPLPAIEKLSESVWRILGGNPGKFQLQGTNTYLLGTGRERLLVDTAQGVPVWIESLKSVLEKENAVVKRALITHFHHDHVGGIADLRKLSPDTVIHKNSPDDTQDEGINDGEVFSVEGATLKAVYTPGHANDHMCFLLAEENAIFTGDNVLGHGTTVFTDLKEYMDSLQKMLDLKPARAYPAHGQLIEEGQKKLQEYIVHRQRREAQIVRQLQAVRAEIEADQPPTPVTSMELVKRIYVDVDPGLHLAAEGGVVQVLDKLEKEGRVAIVVKNGMTKYTLVEKPSSPSSSSL